VSVESGEFFTDRGNSKITRPISNHVAVAEEKWKRCLH